MTRILATAALALALPFGAPAASPDEISALTQALAADEMIEILREEGLKEAGEIADQTFSGRPPSSWDEAIATIYDPERLQDLFQEGMARAFAEVEIGPILDFFESETGQRIVTLELTGRRAFMSEDVEAAATEAWAAAVREGAPRVAQIERFIEVNDLLERNVEGALNSSLAFFRGLGDAGPFPMTEEQILADVWSQEPMIRRDSRDWLTAYLAMSYEPLDDATLDDYIELSETPQGQAFNAALFEVFDALFDDVSYRLGATIATLTTGEEL